MRAYDEKGITLVEVLITTVIAVAFFASSSLIIASVLRYQKQSSAKQYALTYLSNFAESSQAYGCGLSSGMVSPLDDPTNPSIFQTQALCSELFEGQLTAGDPIPFTIENKGVTYTVQMTSTWEQILSPQCEILTTTQPQLLSQTYSISWETDGKSSEASFSQLLTPNLSDPSYAAPPGQFLVVKTSPLQPVTLEINYPTSGTIFISHITPESGCTIFPYLQSSSNDLSYQVSTQSARTPVTIQSGVPTEVVI